VKTSKLARRNNRHCAMESPWVVSRFRR